MTPPGTVNATDQAKIIDYLTNYAGNLYIEGTKIGYDHFATSMLTHFGIKYDAEGDFYEVNSLDSQHDELMEDVNFVYSGGDSPHYLVDRLITTGADIIYTSEDGFQRTFAYNADDLYKVISSSVLFSAFKDGDSLSMKPYLMAEMINYFLGLGTTTGIQNLFGASGQVAASGFPNPFAYETSIEFELEKGGMVKLSIYDNIGRPVKVLLDSQLPAGKNDIIWNATDSFGRAVANGIYFFTVQTHNHSQSGKLVLKR
jgi:hypothetical protein